MDEIRGEEGLYCQIASGHIDIGQEASKIQHLKLELYLEILIFWNGQ